MCWPKREPSLSHISRQIYRILSHDPQTDNMTDQEKPVYRNPYKSGFRFKSQNPGKRQPVMKERPTEDRVSGSSIPFWL